MKRNQPNPDGQMKNKFEAGLLISLLILVPCTQGMAQQKEIDEYESSAPLIKEILYKEIDTLSLHMKLFYPKEFNENKSYPAILFFFGGGWNKRNISQFEPHAKYFSSRGMISIIADYRVRDVNGTTPFDAVGDAKSAIRYIRSKAGELQINSLKIVASGGSAGGHLAAATALIDGLDNTGEDLSVSSKPMALVLFNPVFDNGPDGYGYERTGARYKEISPLHNIKMGAPPTIVFLGTNDRPIPVATAEKYKEKMDSVGSRCDLFIYKDQGHGFFNYRHTEYFNKTVLETDRFLTSLGYLKKL